MPTHSALRELPSSPLTNLLLAFLIPSNPSSAAPPSPDGLDPIDAQLDSHLDPFQHDDPFSHGGAASTSEMKMNVISLDSLTPMSPKKQAVVHTVPEP